MLIPARTKPIGSTKNFIDGSPDSSWQRLMTCLKVSFAASVLSLSPSQRSRIALRAAISEPNTKWFSSLKYDNVLNGKSSPASLNVNV